MSEQAQVQAPVFRITMTAAVQANNPIEAAHLFARNAGQEGFDKFSVTDPNGVSHVVDLGLLFKMGLLKVEEEAVAQEQEAVGEADIAEAE
ncbi:hypothetical protein R2R70_02180 [Cobetia sp. SIMBA_158]|uniref:hypothetical protein n=1 Tax=Cobetia sp. SIMBA_158 TaxID=3081617 RepID=UPI00397FCC5F